MRFYSQVTNKPNSIIEQVKDGTRVISNKKLCVFRNGVLDTEDEELIIKLKKRPDLFRTDRPWTKKYDWRTTPKGIKLLEEGERLGIDCRRVREFYLEKLIADKKGTVQGKTPEAPVVNEKKSVSSTPSTPPIVKIDYQELMKIAKKKGWTERKRVDIERLIKGEKIK